MQTLRRTPLYEQHVAAGARMVPFAGWEMPVQYEGVVAEHRAVRSDCGVFDVSHMGQIEVEGPRAVELLQGVLSNDLGRIGDGQAQYTLLTNERGGITDDLIAYRLDAFRWLLVVNAANLEPAFTWIKEREIRGSDVRDVSDRYALLAVQGPRSIERLGLSPAPAFTFEEAAIDGMPAMVARTGYTGELGVEILVEYEDASALWDAVVARGAVPCGLGARDTLRLEVCYPLHGNDIDPDTDPISAGLGWTCALDKEFTGVEVIRRIREQGPEERLAAFVLEEPGVPRPGMSFVEGGRVTSGSHSPMLERGIGLAYVSPDHAEPGTALTVDIRGKQRRARVVRKPIYHRPDADGDT